MQKKGDGMPTWFIIFLIPLVAVMVVFMLIPFTQQRAVVGDLLKEETNPNDVYEFTTSQLAIKEKSYLTFDEYFESFKEEQDSPNVLDSDFSINAPRLEYNYSFYSKREYYDQCKTKEAIINFTNAKISQFTFNYQNETFVYDINVYPPLYLFSDQLKTQDCYFEKDKYSQGYLDDPYNNKFIDALARDFKALKSQGYSDDEIVEIATLFVQSIPYGTDKTQLNRYPYETIYEGEGNCLDKSVILVGILKSLGYKTYFILGQTKQYHALVGIVCNKGNVEYNGDQICFAETTIFAPIGAESEIVIEQFIQTSNGENIYVGKHYGPKIVDYIRDEQQSRYTIENELDEIDTNLDVLQVEMCKTDCVFCKGNTIDPERSQEIEQCHDAGEYTDLANEYNDGVEEYNNLIKSWYKVYYDIEKAMFNNVRYLKRG